MQYKCYAPKNTVNGMSALHIILILSNVHFLSWSFILIKDQIVQNVPSNPFIPVDPLMNLNILSGTILKISMVFFNTHDYSS
jgi:hypothetical protein